MAFNLETNYCGFQCKNPFFLASSPVSASGEMIGRAFDAGWAGAVTKSISFLQDETTLSLTPRMLPVSTAGSRVVTGMGNIDFVMDKSVDDAFEDFAQVKKRYPTNMLIVSIKAHYREEDWKRLARKAEQAGADALELCLSCIDSEAGVMLCQDKALMTQVIQWVKEEVSLPVIAKLSLHVNDIGDMAVCAAKAGAAAVTAINSIHGIGPLDSETMVHIPNIMGKSAPMGLSGSFIKPMVEHCVYKIALAAKTQPFQIAAAGGICNGLDGVEYLSLGAHILQSATEVMYKGYGLIDPMLRYLKKFMEEKGCSSLEDFRGHSLDHMVPAARNLSLKQQLAAKIDPGICIGCNRCVISCRDGGKQAISMTEDKKAFVDTKRCTGCGLCRIVCPVGTIRMEEVKRS
ncbi:NAD-dependent dihydropyrimidine dehydrogenase subunit PreA [Enterocloster alcoholdehydrogenati]|uniref:dihydrouracil dehydrogenase (NAD(+)) n=1 Tax=Enterocloster alcoholdehydrogenati TaxID=2547410 RepID=A0ABQ0AY91_9FIRM